jgi:hypothetical protein
MDILVIQRNGYLPLANYALKDHGEERASVCQSQEEKHYLANYRPENEH